ncbi:MAG: transcriptional regulator [Lentisphaerae bacterium RIFOXYB12_FULL_65_16]|nr:MAG: transcriptional regulator [Lentisphaerae bacterium RIFOXYA12_64_32]OGV91293.1 MAG: transcriptional regulator [Lentisphaerae bacterium RIFOXYB12_FULL_65_16]
MSGHNKWSSIKHKKGAADAKRGKVFSRVAKEITLAAREGGGDPNSNARLRSAVSEGRANNMPLDNIERAIKKGTGELEGGPIEELSYEGYAAGGVAVIVHCVSDNRNRTAAEVRSIFTRHSCNMAASGAVARMFQRKARFLVKGAAANEEKLVELLLDKGADVEDVKVADGVAEIMAPAEAFAQVSNALHEGGIPVAESALIMVPLTPTLVSDPSIARQVLRFIELLEDHDDVQQVYSNVDIPDALIEKLAAEPA